MGQETTALVNLPIAFSTAGYWCHMSTSSWNPSSRGLVTAIPNGTSQIKLINGNAGISDCRWYIVGKQQWGLISTSGGLTLQTITYSLSFGNTNYSVFLTPIWTANPGHADYTCASEHNSYHTVSGTKCYNYQEQKIRWLAIGI